MKGNTLVYMYSIREWLTRSQSNLVEVIYFPPPMIPLDNGNKVFFLVVILFHSLVVHC